MKSKELAWHIRRDAIEMTHVSNGSHIGSVLSVADIVAVLYSDVLNYNVCDPKDSTRDFFVLSKGHAGAAIYSALANVGFFEKDILLTHYANGSILSGHVSHKGVPGVEFSTGSLGHGGGVASGVALSYKLKGKSNRVFALLGDGECNEGTVWEMAEFSAQHELDNFCVIIDKNNQQGLGKSKEIINLDNMLEIWKAFGWEAVSINGHDHEQLKKELMTLGNKKPKCIVANTIKGCGISFMEDNVLWHYRAPQDEWYNIAVKELEGVKNEKFFSKRSI